MESPTVNITEKSEPLQIHSNLTDDWVKPFECNHVVVKYTKDMNKDKGVELSQKKKKTTGKCTDDANAFSSFCVMCGEMVSESSNNNNTDDFVHELGSARDQHLETRGKDRSDSKRPVFRRKISSTSLSSSKVSGTDPRACLIHSHKKIKYFCEDHQEVCCSVCVTVLHRGCQRVMHIKDELQSGWDSRVSEETVKSLHLIEKSFEQILSYNETAQKKLHEQVEDFRRRREVFRSKILKLVDDFDKTSEKQVKTFIKLSENNINSTIDICKDIIRDIGACNELLELSLHAESEKDTFIATQKVLKQKTKFGLALSEAIKQSKDFSVDLIPQSNVDNIEDLKKAADVQFCALETRFPQSVLASVSKLPMSDLRSPRDVLDAFTRSESTSSLESSVTFYGKFNVRLADDKNPCENVDAAFLADGRVVITDMKNRKLKVFDSRFTKASVVELTSEPRGVSVISPQEVAVTLPDESKIQFVSTGKRPGTTRSILTNLPGYGITCQNQELVVLCDDGFSTTAIQVLDFGGKELKTLKMNKSGKVILKNPWNIATSLDGQHVCVTDRGRLVCLDFSGTVIFHYADENLENARGLAADDLGRFYVCGTGSCNVHQISSDGKKTSIILDEKDVPSPQAVCFQSNKRQLLLTSVGDDHVYLYKLAK